MKQIAPLDDTYIYGQNERNSPELSLAHLVGRLPSWRLALATLALVITLSAGPVTGLAEGPLEPDEPPIPNTTIIEDMGDGSFRYLVSGQPQVFIGMGYNPIYRYLSDEERAASYDRDFRILCQAGVNHIIGWDADKGYDQDKFDELTLDYANKYGIGVVMPFYLPGDGDYRDEAFTLDLLEQAAAKVMRFKDHPALRMWGVGNEVLMEIPGMEDREAFGLFYLQLADLIHILDPNHPVIYREAEDYFVSEISVLWQGDAPERPWLLYGMNIYSDNLERILQDWPTYGLNRPLFITEFGAEPDWLGDRADGYLAMWWTIRGYPSYVLGGAPYAWTVEGPEPTDPKWGLIYGDGQPVDDTFPLLKQFWKLENGGPRSCPAWQ